MSDTKLTKEHSEDAFSAQRGKFRNTRQRGNTDNRSKFFQSGNTENQSKFFQGKCHNCQEKGHFSRDCPKKKTKNESSKTTKSNHMLNGTARCAKEQCSESLHDDEALTSSSFIVCGRSDWIIDS